MLFFHCSWFRVACFSLSRLIIGTNRNGNPHENANGFSVGTIAEISRDIVFAICSNDGISTPFSGSFATESSAF